MNDSSEIFVFIVSNIHAFEYRFIGPKRNLISIVYEVLIVKDLS